MSGEPGRQATAQPQTPAQPHPLLHAPLLATLLKLASPAMLAMVGTSLAAISETVFVGRLGVNALAGMALVFPIVMLQQMLSSGAMGTAVSGVVSRTLGAGQRDRAQALAMHALGVAVVAGLLSSALMLTMGRGLFWLLGGRGEPLEQAMAYAQVAFVGSVGVWVLNTLASLLRATGNMVVPSAVYLGVAVVQVLAAGTLGLGWGPVPRAGMAGVAAGQVLAYAGGACVLWVYMRRGHGRIRLELAGLRLKPELLRELLRQGALACVSPLQTVGTILILTHLVARFGPQALAGYGIGTRVEFLLIPLAFSFGVASVPVVGMSVGAGLVARARRAAWAASAMAGGLLGIFGLVLALWPHTWSQHFTPDETVLAIADTYFRWVGPCYALFGVGMSLFFSSIGAGKPGGPVLAGTLRLVLVAAGGMLLVAMQWPLWTVFALIALATSAYGLGCIAAVWRTPWGAPRSASAPR
jgi:putative MATE family efflux protein